MSVHVRKIYAIFHHVFVWTEQRNRNRDLYNQLLTQESKSVKKQLELLKLRVNQLENGTELQVHNLIIHTVKVGASEGMRDDRYESY